MELRATSTHYHRRHEGLPETRRSLLNKGLVVKGSEWKGVPFSAPFVGVRYMVPGDPAVVLLFDANGYIAGMQTAVS